MPTEHIVSSYKFNELDDKAKERARDWYREGALDHEWYYFTYDDAAEIGLKITGFDLDSRQSLEGIFNRSAVDVANAILKNHGDKCQTYIEALAFTLSFNGEPTEDQETEFFSEIKGAYWRILKSEMEYILSDESVDEMILANEYDFNASGSRFRF